MPSAKQILTKGVLCGISGLPEKDRRVGGWTDDKGTDR